MKHIGNILFGTLLLSAGILFAVSGRGGYGAYSYTEGGAARVGGILMAIFGIGSLYIHFKYWLRKKDSEGADFEHRTPVKKEMPKDALSGDTHVDPGSNAFVKSFKRGLVWPLWGLGASVLVALGLGFLEHLGVSVKARGAIRGGLILVLPVVYLMIRMKKMDKENG